MLSRSSGKGGSKGGAGAQPLPAPQEFIAQQPGGRRRVASAPDAALGKREVQRLVLSHLLRNHGYLEAAATLTNFVGLCVGILAAEAVYCARTGTDARVFGYLGPARVAQSAKLVATVFTLTSLVLLGLQYYVKFYVQRAQGLLLPRQAFYQSALMRPFLVDFLICSLHCPAGLGGVFTFGGPLGTRMSYDADGLLSLFMFLRLKPFLFWLLQNISGFNSAKAVLLGSSQRVGLNSELAFRYVFFSRPVTSTFTLLLLLLLSMAYFMSVAERDICNIPELVAGGLCRVNLDLGDYRVALWLVFITATTVGYGDVVPYTYLGRAVSAVCCLSGILVVAMLVQGINTYFTLDSEERSCTRQLEVGERFLKRKRLARAVIKAFLLVALVRVVGAGRRRRHAMEDIPRRTLAPLYRAMVAWRHHQAEFVYFQRHTSEMDCLREDVRCLVVSGSLSLLPFRSSLPPTLSSPPPLPTLARPPFFPSAAPGD